MNQDMANVLSLIAQAMRRPGHVVEFGSETTYYLAKHVSARLDINKMKFDPDKKSMSYPQ